MTRLLVVLGLTTLVASSAAQESSADAKTSVRHLIDRYIASVDRADTALAARIWSTTPDATFIYPLGTERGWEQIKKNVYENTMGALFSERSLKVVGPVAIHVYGTAAVAEFEWEFIGKLRDGTPHESKGRESQVYANLPGQGWRLVHVHYSGPPAAAGGRAVRPSALSVDAEGLSAVDRAER